MALTQMQQIQSLGEALAWLERELTWGVQAAALSHLCGRIGELYACVITNGQMAAATNQRGYDVITGTGERVSVKTTTRALPCHMPFNPNTLHDVDRVIVLRINTDEMQVETIYDQPIAIARAAMTGRDGGGLRLWLRPFAPPEGEAKHVAEVRQLSYEGYRIVELETGSIQVWSYGERVEPALPVLRKIALSLGLDTRNGRGNNHNTRQLGSRVLDCLQERWGHLPNMSAPEPSSNPII